MIDKSCRKVRSNLLLQDCFLRDCTTAHDLATAYKEKTYFELQRTVKQNGITEELVEVPYSITPQTVKSYAASADYHSDPAGAVLRGGQRKNLGDIRSAQQITEMDSSTARSFLADLQARINEAVKKVSEGKEDSVPAPAPAPDGGDK